MLIPRRLDWWGGARAGVAVEGDQVLGELVRAFLGDRVPAKVALYVLADVDADRAEVE